MFFSHLAFLLPIHKIKRKVFHIKNIINEKVLYMKGEKKKEVY